MANWNGSAIELFKDILRESGMTPEFPGSAISRAVYQRDYPTLGCIIASLRPFWENFPMLEQNDLIALSLDGHNGFEEYVCTLLERLFVNLNCFVWVDDEEVLDHWRLNLILYSLDSGDSGSEAWVEKIKKGERE